MAVLTNLDVTHAKHGIFESSRIKASQVGHIYDAIVRKSETPVAVDNGTPIAIGDYTGDGLQTRYAKVAEKGDKIAVVGTPVVIKDAFTKAQEQDYNFYNKAGAVSKAYELVAEDIFAVADYQIKKSGAIAVGDKVIVNTTAETDGTAYEVNSTTAGYGFVGRVHSIAAGNAIVGKEGFNMIRIEVIQNEKQA